MPVTPPLRARAPSTTAVSDADLYDRLLGDFSSWATEATRLGIFGGRVGRELS